MNSGRTGWNYNVKLSKRPPGTQTAMMCERSYHLDMVKLHAPYFDCDIDGSCNGLAAAHQDIYTGPFIVVSKQEH